MSYFLLGIAYSLVTPLGEVVDEVGHFRYVEFLKTYRTLPAYSDGDDFVHLEAHQPPLFYFLGAIITSAIQTDINAQVRTNSCSNYNPHIQTGKNRFIQIGPEFDLYNPTIVGLRILRIISLCAGAATIFLTYRIGRNAFATTNLALAAAAIVAFNPQFLFITSGFNNDALAALMGAAILSASITVMRSKTYQSILILALITGLGLLTKVSILVMVPVAFLSIIISTRIDDDFNVNTRRNITWSLLTKRNIVYIVIGISTIVVVSLLVAGWWFVRAYVLYGNPLMLNAMFQAHGNAIQRQGVFTGSDFINFVVISLESYWLWFGWFNIKAPSVVYWGLMLLVQSSFVGLIYYLLSSRRSFQVDIKIVTLCVAAILSAFIALLIYVQDVNWVGYQGRLAFVIVPAVALILVIGLYQVGGLIAIKITVFTLVILSISALFFLLWPSYTRPTVNLVPEEDITCIVFPNGFQFDTLNVPDTIVADTQLTITFSGYALTNSNGLELLVVSLIDERGYILNQTMLPLNLESGQEISGSVSMIVPGTNISSVDIFVSFRDKNFSQNNHNQHDDGMDGRTKIGTISILSDPNMNGN